MAGYELSEAAVRKLAEIVRAYSAGRLGTRTAPPASPRRDAPYTPEFYRLAVNAGDGAYTLRKQEWDADTDEMINLADGFDPDYNLDIDGFDYQGRADGVAGAAGTGQIVRGWRLFIDDAWITLVDVGETIEGGVLLKAREAPDDKGAIMRDTQDRLAHGEPIHTAGAWNPKVVTIVTGNLGGTTFCFVRYDSRGHVEAYYTSGGKWYNWPDGTESADTGWY